jgi:hypothetical protein
MRLCISQMPIKFAYYLYGRLVMTKYEIDRLLTSMNRTANLLVPYIHPYVSASPS